MVFKDPKVIVGMLVVAYLIYHIFIKGNNNNPIENFTIVKTDEGKGGTCKISRDDKIGETTVGTLHEAAIACIRTSACSAFTFVNYYTLNGKPVPSQYTLYTNDITEIDDDRYSFKHCYSKNDWTNDITVTVSP